MANLGLRATSLLFAFFSNCKTIALQEWGPSCPHEFLDAYRLEYDQSWTQIDDLAKRDTQNAFVDKILNHQLALCDSDNPLGLSKDKQRTAPAIEDVSSQ